MSDTFSVVLRLLLETMAGAAFREPSALVVAAAVFAAVAVLALSLAGSGASAPATGTSPHPMRGIDVSTLLTQSDPDAAGHARPRAPGAAAPAA
ncbi:DUF6412 domain-containing protein [Microbacterium insulae]|uniref:DUF6412 domain-containing protein n=1 Tax=Microbacterium insulae TaxID=483014 RepID=A0ABW3AIM5_9MICO